uniref:Integrase catalytic domain-containing protein n=1 Tax=Peronospora matthiolae TaxID=2874970 RepID=A0AAV1UPC5_9STRA
MVSRDFYWNRQYEFVRKNIRACEVCQRLKRSPSSRAPLQPLPIPAECWQSVSMDFVFGFPKDAHTNNGILVFVDRLSKLVHRVAVPESITAQGCARVFIDAIFRLHGLPRELVSGRDPRFTAEFWKFVFRSLGTRLKMSTSDHPETDGQTERFNRVLEDMLRRYVHSLTSWCEFLPMAEFAINNSVHALTTHTPFYVNGLRHPRLPAFLERDSSLRGGLDSLEQKRSGSCLSPVDNGFNVIDADIDAIDIDAAGIFSIANDCHSEDDDSLTDEENVLSAVHTKRTAVDKDESAAEFLLTRKAVVRFVQDSIVDAIERQKRNADKHGRASVLSFDVGDLALLSTVNLPKHAVTNVHSSKLLPKYIGSFRVLR